MKAIVVKYDVYFDSKFSALFEEMVLLTISVGVDKFNGVVYLHFSSELNLTTASSCLFVAGILHRVTLI